MFVFIKKNWEKSKTPFIDINSIWIDVVSWVESNNAFHPTVSIQRGIMENLWMTWIGVLTNAYKNMAKEDVDLDKEDDIDKENIFNINKENLKELYEKALSENENSNNDKTKISDDDKADIIWIFEKNSNINIEEFLWDETEYSMENNKTINDFIAEINKLSLERKLEEK